MERRWLAITGVLALGAMLVVAEAAEAQRQRGRRKGDLRTPDKLNVGDTAPDFSLKTLDGKETVTLSQFKGKKPVVLIFGSYT